ncbi:major facilitator superfamily domain-containing protein [Infundibulicybe gibba]|nr:major facilitator superfamily domain-containing protein [Infundibulicybe gibba]
MSFTTPSRAGSDHASLNEKQAVEEGSTTSGASLRIDPVAERALIRSKADTLVAPGNAKISGLEKDLGMEGFDFNIALTIFYISYILADIPSNLALKRYGSRWLAGLIIAFGLIALSTAFVTSYTGLIITRIFLGFAEGGTLYYRRSELVFRVVIFIGVSAPLAGASSGLLSIRDFGSVKSWRKIFLVEGIITTGFGLLCIAIIPTDPQKTRILRPEERELALARINADQPVDNHGMKERTTLKLVLRSLNFNASFFPPVIICTINYILINISFQARLKADDKGLSLFLPTVISSLGHYTVVQSQLRTVPPYIIGAVWSGINVYLGWRVKQRSTMVASAAALQLCGYAIAIATRNQHARFSYAACFLAIAGTPAGPVLIAWGTDNAAPDTVRAVTTALIPGFGALGSVIAVWTYLPADAPNFHKGNTLNLVSSVVILLLTLVYVVYIRLENARRERGERDYRLEGKTVEEEQELGYLHPRFRYQI